MHSFSMRPAKYFYDKPLPKYLDPKTVLTYRPHPVYKKDQSFWLLSHLVSTPPPPPPQLRRGQRTPFPLSLSFYSLCFPLFVLCS